MTYPEIYEIILNKIKNKKIKVIHKSLKGNWGYYANDHIVIEKTIRNTLTGCIVLLHEYRHLLDDRENKSKLFYRYDLAKLNISKKRKIEIIWNVEWKCFEYARDYLEQYGISRRDHKFLQKTYVRREILPVWIKDYLNL